jgi:hypothetical protein
MTEKKYRGFCTLDSPLESKVENWIPNISYKLEYFNKYDIHIPVIKEWKDLIYFQYKIHIK